MDTDEVSCPAKSKLSTKSRICSLERSEFLRTHPSRSSFSLRPLISILSSIFLSMNWRIVDRDCKKRFRIKMKLSSENFWIYIIYIDIYSGNEESPAELFCKQFRENLEEEKQLLSWMWCTLSSTVRFPVFQDPNSWYVSPSS